VATRTGGKTESFLANEKKRWMKGSRGEKKGTDIRVVAVGLRRKVRILSVGESARETSTKNVRDGENWKRIIISHSGEKKPSTTVILEPEKLGGGKTRRLEVIGGKVKKSWAHQSKMGRLSGTPSWETKRRPLGKERGPWDETIKGAEPKTYRSKLVNFDTLRRVRSTVKEARQEV